MEIKLAGWEVMVAVENLVKLKYGFEFEFMDDTCDWPDVTWQEAVYAAKKHKNGRVMKDPIHGFVLNEIVKYEDKSMSFSEDVDFTFYISPNNEETA